jgi:hypothetical protein
MRWQAGASTARGDNAPRERRLRAVIRVGDRASLALGAMSGPALAFVALWAGGAGGRWNDFASYWLAGRLVAAGASPYDLAALTRLGDREGIAFLAGSGYSYPLPFAVAMAPLSALPFSIAAALFTALSIGAFGLAVAAWLGDSGLGPCGRRGRLLAALAAGLYPPVIGSAWVGQANLLVVALLAIGVRSWLRSARGSRDEVAGGFWVGLAGIVKVAPLVLLVPPILARRWRSVAGLGLAVLGALGLAAALAPTGFLAMQQLGGLGDPDPYWTNQSLNGFASRLTLPTVRNVPLAAGLDPVLLLWVLAACMGIGTLVVLVRARARMRAPEGYALAIGFALVAAVAAAPKDSFWNHVPALLGAALLLASGSGTPAMGWRATHSSRLLLTLWAGLAALQVGVDALPDTFLGSVGPASSILSSVALYGLVALWVALGVTLLSSVAQPRAGVRPP